MEHLAILETKNLTKHFGGLAAVHQVSLSFYPGKLQSIIGPNGAGKTTFFNLISGMFQPTSGQILFRGKDITRLSRADIFRVGIVRTFQISSIFPELTVLKNVEIAAQGRYRTSNSPLGRLSRPRKELSELSMSYLARLEMAEQWNQKAGLLNYGDKRRLEIVMGLVSKPKLLLLDEPTAGMSPEETHHTAQLLRDLSSSITILLVEHDMKLVMGISDRVTVLHYGKVLTSGTPDKILKSTEVQSVYLSGGAC